MKSEAIWFEALLWEQAWDGTNVISLNLLIILALPLSMKCMWTNDANSQSKVNPYSYFMGICFRYYIMMLIFSFAHAITILPVDQFCFGAIQRKLPFYKMIFRYAPNKAEAFIMCYMVIYICRDVFDMFYRCFHSDNGMSQDEYLLISPQ